jgi:hypothetical protein
MFILLDAFDLSVSRFALNAGEGEFIEPKSDEKELEERAVRYFDSFQLVKTSQ